MDVLNRVTSADGTTIAFQRWGAGPATITVDPAGSYRDFRPLRAPVELLAADFTVYAYDRRGRRRDAVEFFHRGIGMPEEVMAQMSAPVAGKLEAVAHTLVYDCQLSDNMSLQLVRSVTVPTLVIDSQGSSGELTGMAATVVEALPNSTHRSLAGEWHGVPDETLAPVLTEFFQT
jgi:hypothetical protein